MALRKYYIGSLGPFLYDDTDSINDPDGDFAGEDQKGFITDGPVKVGATPGDATDVLRLEDVGVLVGSVIGPGSSTDNAIVRFSGTTGKIVQNSSVSIDDSGNVEIPANLTLGLFTSSYVLYAGVGGLISESANLTFDGTNLSIVAPTSDLHAATKKFVDDSIEARIEEGTAQGQLCYWDTTSGKWLKATDIFWDESTGSLGIGVSPSVRPLDVQSSLTIMCRFNSTSVGGAFFDLGNTAAGRQAGFRFVEVNTSKWSIGNDGSDSSKFKISIGGNLNTPKVTITQDGYAGIGTTAPTAVLHLKAGTAAAGTAPLKFTAGTKLTTPEAGAIDYTTALLELQADAFKSLMNRQVNTWHAYGGFQEESETISIATVDVWYHITNATNDLWTGLEAEGMSLSSDIMTITNAGDYSGSLSMSFSGSNGKDFQLRVYNITQSAQQGYYIGASTAGAGNFTNVVVPLYLEADAGDTFRMEVRCISDSSDPTFKNAIFNLQYLHD